MSTRFRQAPRLLLWLGVLMILAVPLFNVFADNNDVDWNGLGHNSRDPLYRYPQGAVTVGTPVTLRLRAAANDLTAAQTRVWNDRINAETFYPMTKVASGVTLSGDPTSYDFWEVTVPAAAAPTIYWYRFVAIDGSDTNYYEDDEARLGGWGQVYDSSSDRSWQLTHYDVAFSTPDWIKNATVYQVFVDRFRDGTSGNNPTAGGFFYGANDTIVRSNTTDWNAHICDPRSIPGSDAVCAGRYSQNFYGGDLQGLIDELPYLQSIGITALYLNPIFESPSNHKYDTTDFFSIDDNFGDLATFQALSAAADAAGMNIILDGVFNHSSSDSIYFDRYSRWDSSGNPTTVGTNDGSGACESLSSPYVDWYPFFAYVGPPPAPCSDNRDYPKWFGIFDSLPVYQHDNADVRDLFINNGTASVGPYWMQWADGWRLDVAPEIDPGDTNDPSDTYWDDFRAAVRAVNPDTYIVGEEWGNPTSWTISDEWDATMNYQFSSAVLSFFRDTPFTDNDHNSGSSAGVLNPLNPTGLNERLLNLEERYAPEAFAAMMNLLGSHDTSRALFMLDHNVGSNDTALYNDPAYDWSDAIERLKAVWILQFTLPGAPTTYYGDEVGLVNPPAYDGAKWEDDPYNRAPFPWLDESGTPYYTHLQSVGGQADLRDTFSTLTTARTANPALRTGEMIPLLMDDTNEVYAYLRLMEDDSDAAVVIVNSSSTAKTVDVPLTGYLPANWAMTDLLSGDGFTTVDTFNTFLNDITIPAMSGRLLVGDFAFPGERPACIADVTATAGTNQITLNWTAEANTETYMVYRSRLPYGGFELLAGTPDTTYTDIGLTNSTRYYYRIVGRAGVTYLASDADCTTEVSAVPAYNLADEGNSWYNLQWPPEIGTGNMAFPQPVYYLSAITPTTNIYGQIWINGVTQDPGATPNLLAEVGYGPQNQPPSSGSWAWFSTTFNGQSGNNDEFVGNLLPTSVGTFSYAYRYSADGGNSWYYGDLNGRPYDANNAAAGVLVVSECQDTTVPGAPGVPLNLAVTATTSASVSLSWDANTEADIYGYQIWRDGVKIADVIGGATTTYTDTTVAAGTTYSYTVRAMDNCFNPSGDSASVSATAQMTEVQVTFRVTTPAAYCPGDIYIAGSFPPPNPQWNPSALVLTDMGMGVWERTFTVLDGVTIEYKYTRGAWERVEKGANGNDEIANRQVTVDYGTDGTMIINNTIENWRDPCVYQFSPGIDAINIPSSSDVIAVFNQAMQPSSLNTCFTVSGPGGAVAGAVTTVGDTATFDPVGDLAAGSYTATITGCTDAGGDGQQVPAIWTFTVAPDVTTTPTVSTRCIVVSRTLINVTEGGTSAIYNVRLSSPPLAGEQVTITPTGYAAGQIMVSPASRTLDLSNWNTGRNFTVTAVDDSSDEPDFINTSIMHTVTVTPHSGSYSGAVGCVQHILVTVADNDDRATDTPTPTLTDTIIPTITPTPTETATATSTATNTAIATNTATSTAGLAGIHVQPVSVTVSEGGTGINFSVRLAFAPALGEEVTITAVASDGTQFTLTPVSRKFTLANWNNPRGITVNAVDDANADGTFNGQVTFSVTSSNPASPYFNFTPSNFVSVTVNDNE